MPAVHREAGLVFRFFSNENQEPPHIHVYGQKGSMKIWLNTNLDIAKIRKLSASDQRRGMEIVKNNKTLFLEKWYEFKKRENN